jgi:hypothetical protein
VQNEGTCHVAPQKTESLQRLDSRSPRRTALATNIYIMNDKSERGSDPENFGVRITEFGVVVEKI